MSEVEAADFLTGSPKCKASLYVKCFHTKNNSRSGASYEKAKFECTIPLPDVEWIDLGNFLLES